MPRANGKDMLLSRAGQALSDFFRALDKRARIVVGARFVPQSSKLFVQPGLVFGLVKGGLPTEYDGFLPSAFAQAVMYCILDRLSLFGVGSVRFIHPDLPQHAAISLDGITDLAPLIGAHFVNNFAYF